MALVVESPSMIAAGAAIVLKLLHHILAWFDWIWEIVVIFDMGTE